MNLLRTPSAVDSHLPYNWNWQRRWTEVEEFLQEHPIILMDVGARGEKPPELDSLRAYVRRVGFEPDLDEWRRLNATEEGIYFPCLLAGSMGRQELNLYRDRGYSSLLTLTDRYQRLFIGKLPIDASLTLDAITLDHFLEQNANLAPDMLKLDTQGSELAILEGSVQSLATIGMVEVEVEFLQMYEGQPLFSDVATFMADQGFELLYLNRIMVNRREVYQGPSRGQLLFADALFGKREDQMGKMSAEQQAKYLILLCQYGHLDIAWQLLQELPEMSRLIPKISSVFRGHARKPVRGVLMQVDKLLAVALHLRRYNQRGTDSDRSWPIR